MLLRLALFVLVLRCSVAAATIPSSLLGRWEGAVSRHGSVQILSVDLKQTGNSIVGTYEIPELALYEEPIENLTVADSAVTLKILYGRFPLIFHRAFDQMTGINTDWGPPVSIHLKKTPISPEPFFTKRDIVFENAGTELSGTLYLPDGKGPFPAIVMVHGSGDQGRFLWYYRSNAYGLLRSGIAVFLYDKRGCGESQGNQALADLETLASDALAARAACLTEPAVDKAHVGLHGSSQGGWVCAAAYRLNHELPFIVMNKGPAAPVFDQELHRVEYSMRAEDFPQPAVDSAIEYTKLYFESVLDKDKWPLVQGAQTALANAAWKDFVNRSSTYNDSDMVWWRMWNYDPAQYLANIKCPVICIFGADDPNVPPEKNVHLMDSLLNNAGCEHEIHVISGLAHSNATYQTLLGGKWEWPTAFWVWSRRPSEIDLTIAKFIRNSAL
jgi:hypothetical protein